MELSKAKEILKEWLEYNKKNKNVLREADTIIAVQETILKALDNSISKKQHDMIVKSMNSIIDSLQEKLDNSISKDEVRKKIEQLEFLRDDAIEDNFLGDARNLKERIDILQELLGE